MTTYFNYCLAYRREDGTTGSMHASRDTVALTLADLAQGLAYYRGLGYTAWCEWFDETCRECHGEGTTVKRTKRTAKRVKCTCCKGLASRTDAMGFVDFADRAPAEPAKSVALILA